jgi:hypothetical protein
MTPSAALVFFTCLMTTLSAEERGKNATSHFGASIPRSSIVLAEKHL